MLHLDGSEGVLPPHGSPVVADGVTVGQVTSSAIHYELGPIALAFCAETGRVIKRSVDPGASLIVSVDDVSVAAAQEVIVPPSAGAEADIPRIPRLR